MRSGGGRVSLATVASLRMARFELVIFDCDGVLVDSERLAVRTEVEILSSLGWHLTEAEVAERFVGRSAEYMHRQIEQRLGRQIDWEAVFESRYRDVFRRELRPVPGVADALQRISATSCVASSGTHRKICSSLRWTGLLSYFDDRIFSVEDVARGKPAPDLFVHAATSMGVAREACAVVEDSPAGIEAGLAAEMGVFAFAGGLVPVERLQLDGVVVFDDMRVLPELLEGERAHAR